MIVRKCEEKKGPRAEFTVEFDSQEFEEALDAAYEKNKDQYPSQGILRRKPTRAALEQKYGEKLFYEDALKLILQKGFDFAAKNLKIRVVGQPSVSDFSVDDDKTVLITYEAALYPKMTIGRYKGIRAHKPDVSVSEEQVEKEIESVRRCNSRIQTVEREARVGDIANIDFKGYIDGEAFYGGEAFHYDLELGSNTFIPGFEPQIVGMRPGDKKDITVTFPEDYSNDLAGKTAVFHVTLNELKETIMPELDDDFVQAVSEYSTIEEYRESVRKELELKAEEEAENAFRIEVMEKIIDGMSGDIPDEMIEMRVEETVEEYQQRFASQGMTFDQYIEYSDTDLDTFRQQIRQSELQQLKANLVFEIIAEHEKFDVSEKEIEDKYSVLSSKYGEDFNKIKDLFPREDIIMQIKLEKARNLVFDSAVAERE